MLAIIIVLALFSVLSFAVSAWTLVYLRGAVKKEHEHIQKLFKTVWKLKDHLQAQNEKLGNRLILRLEEMAGKAAENRMPAILQKLRAEQREAIVAQQDFLVREVRRLEAMLGLRLKNLENGMEGVTQKTTGIVARLKGLILRHRRNNVQSDEGGQFSGGDTTSA